MYIFGSHCWLTTFGWLLQSKYNDIIVNAFKLIIFYLFYRNALVEFRYNQLIYLISLFENVDLWQMIKDTPPHIFLSSIYCNLFISLSNDYKVKIYKTYPILTYSHIWKAMGLCYLPKQELLNDNVKLLKISLMLNDCKNVHTNNFKETVLIFYWSC